MPKKRQPFKSFKPYSSGSSGPSSGTSKDLDKASARSVNDLLANLRRTSIGLPSTRDLPDNNSPSVPPAIREILHIPETPSPAPRRPVRPRFDSSGRRLPAGPPPPRSWVSRDASDVGAGDRALASRLYSPNDLESQVSLPGTYLPGKRSLVDIILHKLALDWDFHKVYNQYYLFEIPDYLKPALIRHISLRNSHGVSLSDLRTILLPPVYDSSDDDVETEFSVNTDVTYLDLSGSLGRSIRIKEVIEFLFPSNADHGTDELEDSWDAAADASPSLPPVLLPNLTHLSLAIYPGEGSGASWKQLLALSSRASSLTHLSLANWPAPCFTPRASSSTVTSPQGQRVAYGGTTLYSHSLDDDWSEALLILRMLSRNLYKLEFLDLSGCGSWIKALAMKSDHDFVDWIGSWGKMSHLRLYGGRKPAEDALTSEQAAYVEAMEDAAKVEKHIRAMRAGQGRFITVDRDE